MATEQLRWGVSPLCWTNDVLEDLGGDIPLDTCLREAREAGYQGIELGRKFPRQASTLRPAGETQTPPCFLCAAKLMLLKYKALM